VKLAAGTGTLAGAGGSFDDVAKLTVYVVDWTSDKMTPAPGGRLPGGREAGHTAGRGGTGRTDHLVEIEATAVLD
jgi:enamine deaminase RidA (YjgF/YER057c/UK114 family)